MSVELICPNCDVVFVGRINRRNGCCSHKCAIEKAHRNGKYDHNYGQSKAKCHPDRRLIGKGLCKSCYYKKWRRDNPDKRLEIARKHYEKNIIKRFGMTLNDAHNMHEQQKGKCPICLMHIPRLGHGVNPASGRQFVVIDHDHETGVVRGLTCAVCNSTRIGANTTQTAIRLLNYLRKHGRKS